MPDTGAFAKAKAYVSWAIGACLTVCATLLGVPAPKSDSAQSSGSP
jgi:hypothetical protein